LNLKVVASWQRASETLIGPCFNTSKTCILAGERATHDVSLSVGEVAAGFEEGLKDEKRSQALSPDEIGYPSDIENVFSKDR
jgi:hypothetical protein